MNCEKQEKIMEYLDGELSQTDGKIIENHLQNCLPCQEYQKETRQAILLIQNLPIQKAPSILVTSILEELQNKSPKKASKIYFFRKFSSIAALFLLILLFWNWSELMTFKNVETKGTNKKTSRLPSQIQIFKEIKIPKKTRTSSSITTNSKIYTKKDKKESKKAPLKFKEDFFAEKTMETENIKGPTKIILKPRIEDRKKKLASFGKNSSPKTPSRAVTKSQQSSLGDSKQDNNRGGRTVSKITSRINKLSSKLKGFLLLDKKPKEILLLTINISKSKEEILRLLPSHSKIQKIVFGRNEREIKEGTYSLQNQKAPFSCMLISICVPYKNLSKYLISLGQSSLVRYFPGTAPIQSPSLVLSIFKKVKSKKEKTKYKVLPSQKNKKLSFFRLQIWVYRTSP